MKQLLTYVGDWFRAAVHGWNRFWFEAVDPATLCLIRLLTGAMLFYTHFVWTLELEEFFFADGALDPAFVRDFHGSPWAWSHFQWIESPTLLWSIHACALAVLAMFTIGLYTRVTSVFAFLITVSYCHRVPVALFGLDQINGLLALYLMIGPSGAALSLDSWLRRRGEKQVAYAAASSRPRVSANVAIRLIQVHMCVVYLFAGAGKLLGQSWWDGTAMWGALANQEYQTVDMTWLAQWPLLVNFLTHVVVAWELSYCFLIWPKMTRPVVLLLALPLHIGIAVCMGMITFGVVMLIGNLAFVSPRLIRMCLESPASPAAGTPGEIRSQPG